MNILSNHLIPTFKGNINDFAPYIMVTKMINNMKAIAKHHSMITDVPLILNYGTMLW